MFDWFGFDQTSKSVVLFNLIKPAESKQINMSQSYISDTSLAKEVSSLIETWLKRQIWLCMTPSIGKRYSLVCRKVFFKVNDHVKIGSVAASHALHFTVWIHRSLSFEYFLPITMARH